MTGTLQHAGQHSALTVALGTARWLGCFCGVCTQQREWNGCARFCIIFLIIAFAVLIAGLIAGQGRRRRPSQALPRCGVQSFDRRPLAAGPAQSRRVLCRGLRRLFWRGGLRRQQPHRDWHAAERDYT